MNKLLSFLALTATCVTMTTAQAQLAPQVEAFKAGQHYTIISPAQPTANPEMIEVVEVFSYMCPHCKSFQPFIDGWLETISDDIDFRRQPVVFGRPQWAPLARAYYTIDALGMAEEAHGAIFDALHDQRKNLATDEAMAEFLTEHGISEEDYLKTAQSFAIETKLKRGISMTKGYGITGTPSVVVNGKYLTTASMAGSAQRAIEVVNYLIDIERNAIETAQASSTDNADTVISD